MKNETRQSMTYAPTERSSIERLPPALQDAVNAAVAGGATIDEITARIRAHGGACSRSAVGRYVRNVRGMIRQQHESDRAIEAWLNAFGARTQGRAGLVAIETLRTLALSSLADLSERQKSLTPDEVGRLALALKRIEGTDKLRLEREGGVAKGAPRPGQAPGRKGLSAEAVTAMREAIEGKPRPERAGSSAPSDPWNPSDPIWLAKSRRIPH